MSSDQDTAKGVDALIARLRDEGVAAGVAEAERLTAEAQTRAAKILAEAEASADSIKKEAQAAADRYTRAGEEALNTAMRDAVLTMKSTLMARRSPARWIGLMNMKTETVVFLITKPRPRPRRWWPSI